MEYIVIIIKTGEEFLVARRGSVRREFPRETIGSESPIDAARRKLQELMGDQPVELQPLLLSTLLVAPPFDWHIFLAQYDRETKTPPGFLRYAVDVWEMAIRSGNVTAFETLGAWGVYAAYRNRPR